MSAVPPAVLTAALRAAELGWFVFPLIAGSKWPRWKSWASHATRDPALIRSWPGWAAGRRGGRFDNLGIACRPSGLVVLDLDLPKPDRNGSIPSAPEEWAGAQDGADAFAQLAAGAGATIPETHTVSTRTGGRHLYFTAPPEVVITNSRSKVAWLVDVRAPGYPDGDGGYVVGAGSWVRADANGPAGRYATVRDVEALALPDWLTDALTACTGRPGTGSGSADTNTASAGPLPPRTATRPTGSGLPEVRSPRAYGDRCLDNAVRELRAAVPAGQGGDGRNDTLNRVAFTLGRLVAGGLLPEERVVSQLTQVAQEIGLDTRETPRSIASGLTAGKNTPRRSA